MKMIFLAFACMGIPPNGVGENIAYDFDTQPFRLLAKARSHLPFQGRYNRLDLKLQFAIMTNLYMLPERELAKSRSDFD
ncbi:hypothetical protein [Phascolarctobacterium succinatutens]|uniref:hypothetical protein n=1 Tax=Phascolarctobacterium succinatutens TaxID=626940 RepID=UPI00307C7240